MLILRRKVGEKIVIGEGITVIVNRVSGGRVTLGIEAPSEVHIVRGELKSLDAIAASTKAQLPVSVDRPSTLGASAPPLSIPPTADKLAAAV